MSARFTPFTAGKDDDGRRLDRILRKLLPDRTLSRLYAALRKGDVRIQGKKIDASYRVHENEVILIHPSLLEGVGTERPARPASRSAAVGGREPKGPFDIGPLVLFRNEHILALNKPKGMLVHDGNDSLETAVRSALPEAAGGSLSFSPGPLHRLDRNTSGLILFSASITGARTVTECMREGRLEKYYLAVLDGRVRESAVWRHDLLRDRDKRVTEVSPEGRPSKTVCYPLRLSERNTLCLLRIESGRTHQIRAQAAYAGHPLSGDVKYGGSGTMGGYLLHAYMLRLKIPEPVFGFRELSAPLFPDAERCMEALFGESVRADISPDTVLTFVGENS